MNRHHFLTLTVAALALSVSGASCKHSAPKPAANATNATTTNGDFFQALTSYATWPHSGTGASAILTPPPTVAVAPNGRSGCRWRPGRGRRRRYRADESKRANTDPDGREDDGGALVGGRMPA